VRVENVLMVEFEVVQAQERVNLEPERIVVGDAEQVWIGIKRSHRRFPGLRRAPAGREQRIMIGAESTR